MNGRFLTGEKQYEDLPNELKTDTDFDELWFQLQNDLKIIDENLTKIIEPYEKEYVSE
jgi:hypothetical protein